MIRDILKSFSQQRNALAAGYDALDGTRAEIAEKVREIEVLRSAPRPVADALEAFDEWCDRIATAAVDRISPDHFLEPTNTGEIRLPRYHAPGGTAPDLSVATEILLGLLVLTGRNKLREVIAGQLGDLVAGRETLSPVERAERISAAQAELLYLHLVEEQRVRQMQESGLSVSRRADAPALALLACDASLSG